MNCCTADFISLHSGRYIWLRKPNKLQCDNGGYSRHILFNMWWLFTNTCPCGRQGRGSTLNVATHNIGLVCTNYEMCLAMWVKTSLAPLKITRSISRKADGLVRKGPAAGVLVRGLWGCCKFVSRVCELLLWVVERSGWDEEVDSTTCWVGSLWLRKWERGLSVTGGEPGKSHVSSTQSVQNLQLRQAEG